MKIILKKNNCGLLFLLNFCDFKPKVCVALQKVHLCTIPLSLFFLLCFLLLSLPTSPSLSPPFPPFPPFSLPFFPFLPHTQILVKCASQTRKRNVKKTHRTCMQQRIVHAYPHTHKTQHHAQHTHSTRKATHSSRTAHVLHTHNTNAQKNAWKMHRTRIQNTHIEIRIQKLAQTCIDTHRARIENAQSTHRARTTPIQHTHNTNALNMLQNTHMTRMEQAQNRHITRIQHSQNTHRTLIERIRVIFTSLSCFPVSLLHFSFPPSSFYPISS